MASAGGGREGPRQLAARGQLRVPRNNTAPQPATAHVAARGARHSVGRAAAVAPLAPPGRGGEGAEPSMRCPATAGDGLGTKCGRNLLCSWTRIPRAPAAGPRPHWWCKAAPRRQGRRPRRPGAAQAARCSFCRERKGNPGILSTLGAASDLAGPEQPRSPPGAGAGRSGGGAGAGPNIGPRSLGRWRRRGTVASRSDAVCETPGGERERV